jgi:hypothetical protein
MIPPAAPPAQYLPDVVPVSELLFIGLLVVFFAAWGWRHGLDAVIIAGLVVVLGRVTADTLAIPVGAIINMFYGIFNLLTTGRFSGNNLFAVIAGDPNVVKPLINIRDAGDPALVLMGTILFVLIAFAGFRIAQNRAGGRDSWIESVFGFIGGGLLGYVCVTHVIDRHMHFPQVIEVVATDIPQIKVDAPLLVAIIVVIIVFGIQRSKAPAKKK